MIAILKPDEGQVIPFWSATSGLPVKVRINNIRFGDDRTIQNSEMLYEVGRGIVTSIPNPELQKTVRESIEATEKPERANKGTTCQISASRAVPHK